ncbi:hypothetical protein HMPREF0239_02996 [Clostridium sp. ATCC BAA-442]|nr:hypothetical protein HMPREF0239_02996 [Clostridium sp. ATCC BAA-442]
MPQQLLHAGLVPPEQPLHQLPLFHAVPSLPQAAFYSIIHASSEKPTAVSKKEGDGGRRPSPNRAHTIQIWSPGRGPGSRSRGQKKSPPRLRSRLFLYFLDQILLMV